MKEKIVKKILSLLLIICILIGIMPMDIFAVESEMITVNGDVYKILTKDVTNQIGTVSLIKNNSNSLDIEIQDSLLHNDSLLGIPINYSLTEIGERAFENNNILESVIIPNTVKIIGKCAFAVCSKLSIVTIGESVEEIGDQAFSWCQNLSQVTIGNSVKTIGKNVFGNCTAISTIIIPNSVEIIDEGAFSYCENLESLTIGEGVKIIGNKAFGNCEKLVSIIIPDSVEIIGQDAFYQCKSLEELTIGNSVNSIGITAFLNCNKLSTVTIPNSVISIGKQAFDYCQGLETVIIGNQVEEIGESAFFDCKSLTNVIIPDSVKNIGTMAFRYCTSLSEVTFLGDVPSTFGNFIFDECDNLSSIYVPAEHVDSYKAKLPSYKDIIKPIVADTSKYPVTVTNGSGSGDYLLDTEVTITADLPQIGEQFDKWEITPEVTFIDPTTINSPVAKFSMPNEAVSAIAKYIPVGPVDITADFTDLNFRAKIYSAIGKSNPQPIYDTDVNWITSLDASNKNIERLDGIEHLIRLEVLYCNDNKISSLDATKIHQLTALICKNNKLTTLDLTSMENLEQLDCSNNQINSLSVANLEKLWTLNCNDNELNSLDIRGLIGLKNLYCNDNQISLLDVRSLEKLESLNTDRNKLSDLEVSGLKNLKTLSCKDNFLSTLDLEDIDSLKSLTCENNKLMNFTITGATKLTNLNCAINLLTSLDARNLTSLKELNCRDNNLTSLNIAGMSDLQVLKCYNNWLTTLDLTNLKELKELNCESNQINKLDVTDLLKLEELKCRGNHLTQLEVKNLTKLKYLDCRDNYLTLVNVTGLPNLKNFDLRMNQLTNLYLSDLPVLEGLYCSENQIYTINLSELTSLKNIYCSENQLTELDLSSLVNLENLECYQNKLSTLNVGGLLNLNTLKCQYNCMNSEEDIVGLNKAITVNLIFSPQNASTFNAVNKIINVPNKANVNIPLKLTGTVIPDDATNQTITWTMSTADTTGSIIIGDIFTGTIIGKAKIKASIKDGIMALNVNESILSKDFEQYFTINIVDNNISDSYAVIVNGGSANPTSAKSGAIITIKADIPDGKKFKEWMINSNDVIIENLQEYETTFKMPTHVVEITAIFEEKPIYSINISNDSNGSAKSNVTSSEKGAEITLSAIPNSEYRFNTWEVITNNVTINDNKFIMPGNDVSIKATFEKIPVENYKVTFNLNGGIRTGGGELSQTILSGGSAIAPIVTKTGYTFAGWDKAFTNVTGNLTVIAKFEMIPINVYTVNFNLNGGIQTGGGELSQTITSGGSAIAPIVTKTGYRFIGWDKAFTNVTGNITVTAKFEMIPINVYIVNFNLNGGIRTGGGELSQNIMSGSSAVAPLVTKAGYTFTGWDKGFTNVTGNITVTAKFEMIPINVYTVNFKLNGGIRTGGGELSQTILSGGSAVAPIVTKTAYTFTGWDKGFTNVTGNIIINANWNKNNEESGDNNNYYNDDDDDDKIKESKIKLEAISEQLPKTTPNTQISRDINFIDIENHWAKNDIEFLTSRGLFSGTGENKFSPNIYMTRGMFVTVLGRLAGIDIEKYKLSKFDDVKSDAYYMGYVEWASEIRIVNGVSEEKFAPEQPITREQMAVITMNYTKSIGLELPNVNKENIFEDNSIISDYAIAAVKQMQISGIITGKENNRFDSKGTATRAEVSAVLRRFIEIVEK